jgi:mono/diheme cytochrome c family protein
MKRFLFFCAALALLTGYPVVLKTQVVSQAKAPAVASPAAQADQQRALVTTYCTTCHNPTAKIGGLVLYVANIDAVQKDPATWEKAVRKLRGRLMPPPGAKQPEQKDVDGLVGFLETRLDANTALPKAGYVPIQRMNRTEYAAAVKALVGVDVNVGGTNVLPVDVKVGNLDNIASALTVSPSFVEQYVAAARSIAKHAVGDPSLEDETYKLSQNRGGEAMPLGIRDNGGFRIKLNFPVDGEYRFSILFPDATVGLYLGSLENESNIVIMIDGKIMFKKPIGGMADMTLNNRKAGDGRQQIVDRFKKVPIPIQAGVHDVVIGFIERSRFESPDALGGGGRGGGGNYPGLGDIEIAGPYKPTGAVSAPGRALIFVCDPKTAGEAACAKQIAQNLAKRAYRRPVTDADIAKLIPFYEAGRKEGGNFDQGIQRLVAAVLVSPDFLYRAIRGPEGAKPDTEFALTDLELASRLSFFLWNAPPDDVLLNLAINKGLSKPGVLDVQVKRMLGDPRASSLVSSFAMKWLSLDDLDTVTPDPNLFGQFSDALRQDFSREVESFIGSVLLEDHSVVDLLTSKSTFINQRLAQHYGIQGVTGAQFRKVELTDEKRFGLLGKAAVLMRTSYPDRTSPVLRGAWILGRLQGTPPTPPPPTVENQDLAQKQGEAPKTVRERLEMHRDKATCRQCHGVIDPMGLALENFDAIGRFRTNDAQANNAPIDASSVLPNGIPINGISELRTQLASHPAMFAQAFTEKLMMYAINRDLEYFDMPQIRAVVRGAAKDNYTLSSLVLGVVHSDSFRKQGPASAPKAVAANNK